MDTHGLVRDWVAVFNTGDAGRADRIVSQRFVEHATAPFSQNTPGRVDGPVHLKEASSWLRAQFPDLRMEIEAIVAERDTVAVLVTSTGTNRGPLNGVIPATERTFSARQSHWFRVEDGRLAEHWATRDDLSTMLQLGIVGRPGAG
jgi:predicted ester cyclase